MMTHPHDLHRIAKARVERFHHEADESRLAHLFRQAERSDRFSIGRGLSGLLLSLSGWIADAARGQDRPKLASLQQE